MSVVQTIRDIFGVRSLRREVEALRAALDPEMKDIYIADGGVNIELAGQAVQRLSVQMVAWWEDLGAENYAETSLHPRGKPFYFVFTVQKVGEGAKTPHELRREAERRVAELEAGRP